MSILLLKRIPKASFGGKELTSTWVFLGAQMVKNLPAMQETWILSRVRKVPWRRQWQPAPVFLPGELHKQRSLAGCSPWGCKELDTIK